MLGIFAAIAAEIRTGKNVFEQFEAAPGWIIFTFFLITLATAVPVFKGVPRQGTGFFSADAELLNGRVAMVGFLGATLSAYYFGHSLFFAF